MKARTYVRLSLLIPLLVWGICLLFFIVASASVTEPVSILSMSVFEWIGRFTAFYVFGIIGWILPYILLALLLLSLSFMWETRILIKVYAFSPIAMTLLTLAFVNLLVLFPWDGTTSANLYAGFQDFTSINLFLAVVILAWSYICFGIGIGVYKLFSI